MVLESREGYLVYLSAGDVPFFRVSFSPIFSRTGYQKKASFLEQVVKTCQKQFLMQNTRMRPRGLVTFQYFNSGYPLSIPNGCLNTFEYFNRPFAN